MTQKELAKLKAEACDEYLRAIKAVNDVNEGYNKPLRAQIKNASWKEKKRLRKKIKEFTTAQRKPYIIEIEKKYNVKIMQIVL